MAQREIHNYTCTLSPESLDKAKKELNEDPKTRKLEIQTLRERLLRYPGLTARVDDAFLLKFLRPKKFDQERTFELILNYYKMKKENEDIYAEMCPKFVKTFLDDEITIVLPGAGRNGETFIVNRSELWDTDKHSIEVLFKSTFLILSTVSELKQNIDQYRSEEAQVNGIRFIYDLKGFGWNHCKTFSPSMMGTMSAMFQDAFPTRVKGIHYVNEHSIFDYFFALIKPFLKDKLASRINFHGEKYASLHEFISPEYLPIEYGGKLPSLSAQEFNRRVFEKEADFEEDAKFGFVSMTIKQESKKSPDAMETLPGTFRKFNVE